MKISQNKRNISPGICWGFRVHSCYVFLALSLSEKYFWVSQKNLRGHRVLPYVPARDLSQSGASSVDTALVNLQLSFDIVISGNTDMLDKENKPYNKSVQYDLVERWVPDDWYQPNLIMSQQEALEKIYERAFRISNGLDLDKVKKIFNKQIKLLNRFSID